MPSATAGGITIINFGMGSANAATVMDLLSAVQPKAALFLGKCGGLKKSLQLGDLILPIAAIRGEGTSNDYFPPEVPALPAFNLQKAVSTTIRNYHHDYWTGTVYSTNRRVWEHDEDFKVYLRRIRAMAVDMETATIFTVGFFNKIPAGALLLVSDQPMIPEGIKTAESDQVVTREYTDLHLQGGHRLAQGNHQRRSDRQTFKILAMLTALTRPVSSSITRCELTHLQRVPIDLQIARQQHAAYEKALRSLGVNVISLPEEADLPDAVFVEDTAIVLDECAIITLPGAASRQPEVEIRCPGTYPVPQAGAGAASRHPRRRGCAGGGQNRLDRTGGPLQHGGGETGTPLPQPVRVHGTYRPGQGMPAPQVGCHPGRRAHPAHQPGLGGDIRLSRLWLHRCRPAGAYRSQYPDGR